jgi:hypothetical protein
MKFKFLASVIFIVVLTSCSISSDDNTPQIIRNEWHLKNVSGGIDGVNDDFAFSEVIWAFNETLSTLTVTNNNTDGSKEDGLDSGNYTYSLIEEGNNTFLVVDDHEIGSLTLPTNQLIIDENLTSNGTGADGFIYTFQLVQIT